MSDIKRLLYAQFLTLLLHALILFAPISKKNETQKTPPSPKVIKIKTLGKKNSSKKDIALSPIQSQNQETSQAQYKVPRPSTPKKAQSEQIDLSDLGPKKFSKEVLRKQRPQSKKKPIKKKTLTITRASKLTDYTPEVGSLAQRLADRSDIGVKMILPEGVNIDELNKEEYQFFIFQQRTLKTYINAILTNYREHRVQNPHLPLIRPGKKENLMARVTFDRKGNVERIQIVKSSEQKHVEQYWLKVMNDMQLPNPPKLILDSRENFSFFFRLQIY